jgi:signal recognition particle subunit SRP54
MFESLTDKLQLTFKKLRGHGKLTEANISEAMREIRVALLEADVNYEIVKEFVASVQEECLGAEVIKTVTPGEQLVKVVNDHLIELMGDAEAPLDFSKHPAVIMLVGLHGTGKTTTCAKLAAHLRKENRSSLLVAGDVYRPAAIDQLEILGREIDVPVLADRVVQDVAAIARQGLDRAKREGIRTVIVDTAGRLQIDDEMVQELVRVKKAVDPTEIILVADAALGQEAVSVADHFHKALGITGVILTKMDGDSRGGAALSIRKVTDRPIKFIGVGEKIEDFEIFHPDRMASRILGMGDIVSLVEKAAEQIDEEEAARMAEKLKKNTFDFNDFLQQIRQMSEMGGMESVLKMLPGGANLANMPGMDENQIRRMEAIILSMTKKERTKPDTIDFSRRKRIAKGSGTSLEAVGQLVKQFSMLRKMMKKRGMLGRIMSGMMGGGLGGALSGIGAGGGIPSMSGLPPLGGFGGGGGSNRTPSKKKKRKKKKRR